MIVWPDGPDIDEGSLRLGEELGSGGQGAVQRVLGAWALSRPVVYKRYKTVGADGDALAALVRVPATVSSTERDRLLRDTAWPLARVVRGGQVTGFLMQAIPERYFGPNAVGDLKERQLQFLLYEPKPMFGNIVPVQMTASLRAGVATECTRLVHLLHGRKLVIGDISLMNVLWAPDSPAQVFLIDCDGICVEGRSVLRQTDTPDWNDPQQGSSGPDLDTDRYKLALLVGRVLSGKASIRPGQPLILYPGTPDRIGTQVTRLWDRAETRGNRPDAWEWLQALTAREKILLGPRPQVRQRPQLDTVELDRRNQTRLVIDVSASL
jgi:hypothetical protein